MADIIVDIEADGPVPGPWSMVSFGAVVLDRALDQTFYGQCKPISDFWKPEALSVSGHTREETMEFPDPVVTMTRFTRWLEDVGTGRHRFWADNNGFDFAFINYYFHVYTGANPFGWSSRNIVDLHKGLTRNMYARIGKYRKTKHDHHPVNDARGNAEALIHMNDNMNIQILKKGT